MFNSMIVGSRIERLGKTMCDVPLTPRRQRGLHPCLAAARRWPTGDPRRNCAAMGFS
jgi:hypothetical protein